MQLDESLARIVARHPRLAASQVVDHWLAGVDMLGDRCRREAALQKFVDDPLEIWGVWSVLFAHAQSIGGLANFLRNIFGSKRVRPG